MVIVPSPGSIWDYPYLNQVTSMMGLVYGTRSKPEQDLFPSKIRIPEIHVISPLHLPFHLFNISMRSLRDLRSIIFSCERCMCFFFYFLLSCFSSHQSFWQKISTILEKKRPRNDITIIYLPSSQELSRDLFIFFFFFPSSSPFLPPSFFSNWEFNSFEKAKNVVDKSPWKRGTYVSLHNWIRLRNNR